MWSRLSRRYVAARRDQAGKAGIRNDPDVVEESCSPYDCVRTVVQRSRGIYWKEFGGVCSFILGVLRRELKVVLR